MPTSVRSFDRITIAAPCEADWEAMSGNDQVRFCDHCQLQVTNLSTMTRAQAVQFMAQSRGRLCVRFVQRAGGEIITKQIPQKLHHISRKVSRIAAGAFSATLTLGSAAAQSQSSAKSPVARQSQVVVASTESNQASLGGTVKDPNGALVPQATLTLTNPRTNDTYRFVTTDDGAYKFSLLDAGRYNLSVDAPGFSVVEKQNLELSASANKTIDVDLAIAIVTVDVVVKSELVEEQVRMGMVAIREPFDPLIKAAYKDDLDAVKQLIPTTSDINKWDEGTHTSALAYAIENGNRDMVKLLLAAGAGVNNANRNGETPLMYLASNASADMVHDLVMARADVNARDEAGATVLSHVVPVAPFAAVKALVDAGARIDVKDENNDTLLMRAVENNDPDVVKFLLSAGVDVEARNEDDESALTIAARAGKGENLQTLIAAGGTLNLKTEELSEVLGAAVGNSNSGLAVKILVNAGANVAAKDEDGVTLIMLAARAGHADALKALIDQGADLNAIDKDGRTALMQVDDVDTARVLIDAGAGLTAKNKDGKTALQLAIESDQTDLIKLLKSRGAPE